jgi:N-methylhydantoinase A
VPRARVEIVTYRVRASATSAKPVLRFATPMGPTPPRAAQAPVRHVYWAELEDFKETPVYWGERLQPGNVIQGPAIIQVPVTTIVVHPHQTARLNPYGNVLIDLHGGN